MTKKKQLLFFIIGGLLLTGCSKKQKTESKSLKRNHVIYTHIQEIHQPIISSLAGINYPWNKQKSKRAYSYL